MDIVGAERHGRGFFFRDPESHFQIESGRLERVRREFDHPCPGTFRQVKEKLEDAPSLAAAPDGIIQKEVIDEDPPGGIEPMERDSAVRPSIFPAGQDSLLFGEAFRGDLHARGACFGEIVCVKSIMDRGDIAVLIGNPKRDRTHFVCRTPSVDSAPKKDILRTARKRDPRS